MSEQVEHPSAGRTSRYGVIFLILAVITLIEVLLGSAGLDRSLRTGLFLLMSLGKASLVAAFYMHLRDDSRIYTYIFLGPVILLVIFTLLSAIP